MDDCNNRIKLDKWDYIAATSSGALTAAIDVLWVKDFSLTEAHSWGVNKTTDFVKEVAKSKGYKGTELSGAIKYLEDTYPIPADALTDDFGGGYSHHLRDFSHHPTVTGLLFSVLSQFTGYEIGADVSGKLVKVPLPAGVLSQGGILEKLYSGIVTWVFHMISDVAGSSSSVSLGKEGTGLPGPFMSLIKELSSIPGVRAIAGKNEKGNYEFSVECSKLFNGTLLGEHDANGNIVKGGQLKFDLRTEMGVSHEIIKNKQYLPVLINELLVRGFYSVRWFFNEIKKKQINRIEEIGKIETAAYLPCNSRPLTHMLMLSSATFSVIDISTAGIKAALKNRGNKTGFAVDFIQGINVFGVGRLALAAGAEANIGIEKLHERYLEIANEQLSRMGLTYDEAKESFTYTASKIGAIAAIGTPVGFVSAAVSVYKDISISIKEYNIAEKERILVEEKCRNSIESILAYREQIETAVSQYMESNLTAFADAFDEMDASMAAGNVNGFISGNVTIQKQLGKTSSFASQSEFDDLMKSDDALKL